MNPLLIIKDFNEGHHRLRAYHRRRSISLNDFEKASRGHRSFTTATDSTCVTKSDNDDVTTTRPGDDGPSWRIDKKLLYPRRTIFPTRKTNILAINFSPSDKRAHRYPRPSYGVRCPRCFASTQASARVV